MKNWMYSNETMGKRRWNRMENEYKCNKRFRDYVNKYCKKRKIEVAEAFRHEVVKQAYLYYKEVCEDESSNEISRQ